MTIPEFISTQPAERQEFMTALHKMIIATDKSVIAVIKPMMGNEMILYEERCYMKYGLAGTQKYMSLHCLPMYMNPSLYNKYVALIPTAKFQKGCINFTDASKMPLQSAAALIADCASINIADVLEARKKKK